MKRSILFGTAIATAMALTSVSTADVIFNNFGAGDSYQTNIGWTLSDGAPIGVDNDQGDAFTVTGGNFFLDQIDVAIGLVVGTNRIFLDLYDDAAGEPGSVLEMSVIPVDAALTVEPPTSGGRQVAIALGREGATAPRGRVEANTHQAALLTGIPTPQAPAVAFWLEQSRGGGATVHLSEDEIRRLESLGYVMR